MRTEIKLGNEEVLREIREFRVEINGKIESVRSELNGKIEQLRTDTNDRFNKLEYKIEVLTGRVAGLERDVNFQQNLWGIGVGFISLVIVLVTFLKPISRYTRRFLKPKPDPKPTITLEQVEALINDKLSAHR